MASILITTLFTYPIFADEVEIVITTQDDYDYADEGNGCFCVEEGKTIELTVNTNLTGYDVYWDGGGCVTVDNSGNVTADKAGSTTLTATVYCNGVYYTAECTVYVYRPNGVYYIKNLQYSNYYLNVEDGGIDDYTNVDLESKLSTNESDPVRARQMWIIQYMREGLYSIRPLHKPNMGLNVSNNNVNVYDIGCYDTLNISKYAQWLISDFGTGYLITNNGQSPEVHPRYLTMQAENASTAQGANVVATNYANNNNCRWVFEPISNVPNGVYLYDTGKHQVVSNPTVYVAKDEQSPKSKYGIIPVSYSRSDYDQIFQWSSNNTDAVSVISNDGQIRGKIPCETATITVNASIAEVDYSTSFTVVVNPIPNGTYYIRNKQTGCFAGMKVTNKGEKIAVQYNFDASDSNASDGNTIYTCDSVPKWVFNHVGDQYYTIKLSKSGTSYYMGVKDASVDYNASTEYDADVVLYSGNIGDHMKWKIEPVYLSSIRDWTQISNVDRIIGYKLKPKHAELADIDEELVLATNSSSTSDGVKLIQGDYENNQSYREIWSIIESYDMAFYGIDHGFRYGQDEDIPPYTTSMNHITSFGGYDNLKIETQSDAPECKTDLDNREYVILHAHGDIVSYSNYIILSQNDDRLYSYDYGNVSESSCISSSANYSNLKLVLFMNCHSGETDLNFVSRVVSLGAKNAVGFIGQQNEFAAEYWQMAFWEAYCAGNDIETCVRVACDDTNIIISDVVIGGNINNTIYYQTSQT